VSVVEYEKQKPRTEDEETNSNTKKMSVYGAETSWKEFISYEKVFGYDCATCDRGRKRKRQERKHCCNKVSQSEHFRKIAVSHRPQSTSHFKLFFLSVEIETHEPKLTGVPWVKVTVRRIIWWTGSHDPYFRQRKLLFLEITSKLLNSHNSNSNQIFNRF
jgi:hypothetical protein